MSEEGLIYHLDSASPANQEPVCEHARKFEKYEEVALRCGPGMLLVAVFKKVFSTCWFAA